MLNRRFVHSFARWAVMAAVLCAGMLGPIPTMAGGLILYEVGTDDVGLASAGYGARAQDASTVLTNPAGMTRLDGSQLLLGGQFLYGNLDFWPESGTSPALGSDLGGNPVGWFPGGSAFMTFTASPKIKLGIGLTGNFGLAETYNETWIGRYYIQEATLIGMSFLPSIAYQVSDKVSLGLSVNATYGISKQQVAINNVFNDGEGVLRGPDGQLTLDDKTWGWGANAGLLWEPTKETRIGLVYSSQVNLPFSAPADFQGLGPGIEGLFSQRGILNADIDLTIRVPQGVMASLYHKVNSDYAVLASLGWQQWSKFGQVNIGVDSNDPKSITTDIDFKDTWHAAIGFQFEVEKPWILNMGVAYDSAFQDSSNVSPALPSNAAARFGLGLHHQGEKALSWGVAAEYAYGGTLDVVEQSQVPVALGGRGDLVGAYQNTGVFFLSGNLSWKF